MEYEEWKETVEALFLARTCCTWNDLSGDNLEIERAFMDGLTPEEFVSEHILNYGLLEK